MRKASEILEPKKEECYQQYEESIKVWTAELSKTKAALSQIQIESFESSFQMGLINSDFLSAIQRMESMKNHLDRSFRHDYITENLTASQRASELLSCFQRKHLVEMSEEARNDFADITKEIFIVLSDYSELRAEYITSHSLLTGQLELVSNELGNTAEAKDEALLQYKQAISDSQRISSHYEMQLAEKDEEIMRRNMELSELTHHSLVSLQSQLCDMQTLLNKKELQIQASQVEYESLICSLTKDLNSARGELSAAQQSLTLIQGEAENTTRQRKSDNFTTSLHTEVTSLTFELASLTRKSDDVEEGDEHKSMLTTEDDNNANFVVAKLRKTLMDLKQRLQAEEEQLFSCQVQLKAKEAELTVCRSEHDAMIAYLRNEMAELKAKILSQDISMLTLVSDSVKREELALERKCLLYRSRQSDLDVSLNNQKTEKDHDEIVNAYRNDIASLREQLRSKDYEIESLRSTLKEKELEIKENNGQMKDTMEALRSQMENVKSHLARGESFSKSSLSLEHDSESLSKVVRYNLF